MADAPEQITLVAFSGGGTFFFWELGYLSALPPGRHVFAGASAGAMTAALAACDVPPEAALEAALGLARRARVFQRACGACGIWRALLREWLESLLPEDAAARATARGLTIYVTSVAPGCCARVALTDFRDREDLVRAVLASAHVPLFMDGWPCALARRRACVDGCAFGGHGAAARAAAPGQRMLRVDPNDDPAVARARVAGDWLRAGSAARVRRLYQLGAEAGARDAAELGAIRL